MAGERNWRVRILGGMEKELAYAGGGELEVGRLVRVPLGGRVSWGVVMGEGTGDWDGPLKRILKEEHSFRVIKPDGLELANWMERYYGAAVGRSLEVMIPRALRGAVGEKRERWLKRVEGLTDEEVESRLGRANKQREVYEAFRQMVVPLALKRGILLRRFGVGGAVLDGLVQKGLLEEQTERVDREAYKDAIAEKERVQAQAFELTPEQATAVEGIGKVVKRGEFSCEVLHGVTGSGKTEVYLRLMQQALEMGGTVIFLVPEVALTPQTVSRLRSRLEEQGGTKSVVWHSHLSEGERLDAWRALSTGEARVVVGARSAIFAPLDNLRLVIVDEEHESAYKQEEVPRYHGRDVAVYRAYLSKAVCVLGSATPSMETLHNLNRGKYQLHALRSRVDDRQLPLMHIVDMRREGKATYTGFSRFLADQMRDRWEKKEQTILFINRRGYDASIRCPDCGYVGMCDHCDITLTHHRFDHLLRCHMCGHEEYVPKTCPQCRSPKIAYKGSGTQKVEDIARRMLPGAVVERIDADTMRRKNSFREKLNDFRAGRIDILVGTQMIAKGLDFPNVTLVGLMDADLSLHLPDFRAAERTFQLLVQVSGRAGRGDRAGEVVVQTHLPHSGPLNYARQQDFEGFMDEEMKHRKEFGYPPFRHLLHHLIRGRDRDKVQFYADQWVRKAEPELKKLGVELRGPAPCPVERIKDYFRYQVWYFTPVVTPVVARLRQLRDDFPWDKSIIEIVDVDAYSLI